MTPGATVAVVPNAGHLTMVDNLEGTLTPIRDFLRRVDAGIKEDNLFQHPLHL